MRFFHFVLFYGCFVFCNAQVNLYVSSNTGSDLNTGLSPQAPLKTIAQALEKIDPQIGGVCNLLEGVYHEELSVANLNNVTIKGYDNDFVIIDGTVILDNQNWSHYKDNIYQLQLPVNEEIWQLFIDNERQVMARWPNAQFYDDSVLDKSNWAHGANGMPNGIMRDTEKLSVSGFSDDDLVGAFAIANIGSFRTWVVPIETADVENGIFTYPLVSSSGYRDKHQDYYLEKKLVFLDTENEWFFDKDTHKVYVYGNPNGRKIQAKTQSYFLQMNKANNVTIENVNFFATTVFASKSTNISLKSCKFSYPSCSKRMLGSISYPKTTELSNGTKNTANFLIDNCLFEYTDGEAFYLEGGNNTITNNYIHHIDYSCASLRGLGVTISNKGINCVFKNNTVHTTAASSTLSLGDAPNISYNDLSKTGFLQNDGSLIQLTRTAVDGSVVHHNWLHHTVKSGMRYDAPINDPTVAGENGLLHHNVIWETGKALMIKGNRQKLYNNTCFNNTSISVTILNEEGSNTETIIKNNLADNISGERNKAVAIPGVLESNVFSDTEIDYGVKDILRDPDNYDFRPISSANEVIGQASAIAEINVFSGSEIGAYNENDNWVAGAQWEPDTYPWEYILSVKEKELTDRKLVCYPNPSTGVAKISIKGKQMKSLQVFNSLGMLENNFSFDLNTGKLDLSNLSSGIYYLQVLLNDQTSQNISFIKD